MLVREGRTVCLYEVPLKEKYVFHRLLQEGGLALARHRRAATLQESYRPNTMPLQVEILYNEYQSVAAFAVASLLALLALFTLIIKSVFEWKHSREMKRLAELPPERPY